MKIIHQKEKCIGCGLCASLCSEIFKMNEENLAVISHPEAKHFQKEDILEIDEKTSCAKEAADACPVNCIIIE